MRFACNIRKINKTILDDSEFKFGHGYKEATFRSGGKKKLNYEFRLKMFIWYAIILLSPWMFVSLHIDTT